MSAVLSLSALARAVARTSAFAATLPVAGSGAVPRIVRGALALALVPAVAARLDQASPSGFAAEAWLREAAIGAAFGLAAAIVAAAAAAAGSLVDSALAMRPTGRETVFGETEGPFGRMFSLAFAALFFSTGAATHACERFVAASSSTTFDLSLRGAAALARASIASSLDIAGPAIAAQVVATIVAAIVARAAPRMNGLLLASPLASAMVLLVVSGAVASTMHALVDLARRAAAAPPL
jgi:flagellar biosynthesis protein FliR